jgi:hypothetical protein
MVANHDHDSDLISASTTGTGHGSEQQIVTVFSDERF